MSRGKPDRKPMIALVHNADRAFAAHMVESAHERGRPDIKPSHNAVFAHLGDDARRAADLATAAGMTRQSMGELVRELVDLGILEMVPDPDDGGPSWSPTARRAGPSRAPASATCVPSRTGSSSSSVATTRRRDGCSSASGRSWPISRARRRDRAGPTAQG